MMNLKVSALAAVFLLACSDLMAADIPTFKAADSDSSGFVDEAEFARAQEAGVKKAYAELDKDADGKLSKEEYAVISLQIAPVSGMIAPARCGWAPLWNENHSRSYGLSEEQGQACLNDVGSEPASSIAGRDACQADFPISLILTRHSAGPLSCTESPRASTATVTGMSSISNSRIASMPSSSKATRRELLMAFETR